VSLHNGYQAFGTAPAPRYACRHALCGVHLLRELTFLAEEYGLRWAAALKRSLLTMKGAVARAKAAGRTALARATRARYRRRYAALLAEGEAAERAHSSPPTRAGPTKGKLKRTPAGRLLVRLRRDGAWVLRFLEDFAVPFDNNEAERDLRMMKVEQKISGGFRTPRGATTFATLRSYVVTARKQGRDALSALRDLFAGHPFMPALPE
jgi:transposase